MSEPGLPGRPRDPQRAASAVEPAANTPLRGSTESSNPTLIVLPMLIRRGASSAMRGSEDGGVPAGAFEPDELGAFVGLTGTPGVVTAGIGGSIGARAG